MFGPKFAGLVALFVSLATAQTTTLEAESATLSGVTVATTVPGYSGECAVMLMLPSC
jgi:mannan endo-1,4-beta-mannosidase